MCCVAIVYADGIHNCNTVRRKCGCWCAFNSLSLSKIKVIMRVYILSFIVRCVQYPCFTVLTYISRHLSLLACVLDNLKLYYSSEEDCVAGRNDIESMITPTTTTMATTPTPGNQFGNTLTALGVNAECDPRNDQCDRTQDLSCDAAVYKCRYETITNNANVNVNATSPGNAVGYGAASASAIAGGVGVGMVASVFL